MKTLRTTMIDNIGQINESDAKKEIIRMNKQENTNDWRMDYSDFMDVVDESDPELTNPVKRSDGYVFVTCTPKE